MYEIVRKEQEAFNKLLPELMKDETHLNEWVVFKGEVRGYYKYAIEAYKAGLKEFGVDGGFVIDYIGVHRPICIY